MLLEQPPKLPLPHAEVPSAPGHAAYAFSKLSDLYDALDRGYKLGVSLPDAPGLALSTPS